jgi:parallel beta-helix repeat protein
MRRVTLSLVTLLLLVHVAASATYYVDQDSRGGACSNSNPGTITQPRCTPDAGVQLLSSGDTLYIRGARYVKQSIGQYGPTPVPNGSSWETATTIAAYPGEDAWFYNSAITMINGNSYIIFDRLKLEFSGFYMDCSSHHIRFQNGVFTQVERAGSGNMIQGASSKESGGPSVCDGAHHFELLNNDISNAGGGTKGDGCPDINSSDPNPWCYGMYWSGHHSLFDGNIVHGNGQYGFHIFHSGQNDVTDNVVSNNTFYDNGGASAQRGGMTCAVIISAGPNNKACNNLVYNNRCGIQVDYRCVNCAVIANTVYNNEAFGIAIANGSTQVLVRDNVTWGNGVDIMDNVGDAILINNRQGPIDLSTRPTASAGDCPPPSDRPPIVAAPALPPLPAPYDLRRVTR